MGRSAHCGVCAYQGDSASADPGAWFRALPWEVRCLGIGWGLVPGSAHFLLCLRYGLCTPLATHQTKPSASPAARQGSLRQPACEQRELRHGHRHTGVEALKRLLRQG